MMNKNSSVIPTNYQVEGMPISASAGSAVVRAVAASLIGPELKWEEIDAQQRWHWTDDFHLQEGFGVAEFQEDEWGQVMQSVLRERAKTWEELAGL
jgi:hypothetical protein